MAAYGYPGPQAPRDPTAVTGGRIGAFFIDAAVALFAFGLIFVPLATKRTVNETLDLPGCHRKLDDSSQIECDNRQVMRIGDTVYEADGGPTFGLDLVFSFAYFAALPALTGVTLGKLLTGIRVVDAAGTRAGLGKSTLRWLVFAVDGPFSLFLCGLLTRCCRRGTAAWATWLQARTSSPPSRSAGRCSFPPRCPCTRRQDRLCRAPGHRRRRSGTPPATRTCSGTRRPVGT